MGGLFKSPADWSDSVCMCVHEVCAYECKCACPGEWWVRAGVCVGQDERDSETADPILDT